MLSGLVSGLLWALDTIILGIALSKFTKISSQEVIILAPFVSTFLHDAISSIILTLVKLFKGEYKKLIKNFKTPGGRFVALAAILGGPIGMTGYVVAINNIGPGYTSVISAVYPAIGVLLSFIFLKERINKVQLLGLAISVLGIALIGYRGTDFSSYNNFVLGFISAIMACIGWASEGVIVAYGMQRSKVEDSIALTIRQTSSALFYGIIVITFLRAWGFTLDMISNKNVNYIIIASILGSLSYLLYYKSIDKIGPSKAMPLNVTYVAWSLILSIVFFDLSYKPLDLILSFMVILGSILASIDLTELIKR